MPETETVEVSPEEAAVLAVMRSEDKAGQAVFNYAMRYTNDINTNAAGIPWRRTYR